MVYARNSLQARSLALPGGQDDVVVEVQSGNGVALERGEVNEEVILDGEDGVIGDIGVVARVELSGDALVAVGGDHEMDVSGAHRVAIEGLEESTSSTWWS